MNNAMVSLPIKEWAEMQDRLYWLSCLESAGVDNWGGMDYALDLYNADQEEED